MIRYDLDKLGWFQFEWLTQVLLKSALGIGIESWGGYGDFGRDAYFEGSLRFPSTDERHGPFIFQSKFVESANAAGADHHDTLMSAIRKEARRCKERRESTQWNEPTCYALYTNAPLTPEDRNRIKATFHEIFPSAEIFSFGGGDICDLIDKHPQVKKAFPALLSLRDLDSLLSEVVTHDIIERSNGAISLAKSVLDVFVPTQAYSESWRILHAHNFLVLEGPPEVGKTAIAWMLALAQLSQGWEAVACDDPDDYFRKHQGDRNQIFIADDAFGRTEYDPTRGNEWERQLDRVLRQIDKRHWLVWTSRKHILERALKSMDLQGHAARFPNPGAILVDASKLQVHEKTLILYKHAKAAILTAEEKALVKSNARHIVGNPNFTPERIRRLVTETLPILSGETTFDSTVLARQIQEAVNNPTLGMRKSFQQLSQPHKWVLIGLLEGGYATSQVALKSLYESHCPQESQDAFNNVFDELLESFITLESGVNQIVRWTHPSCRDLVIDELSHDEQLKRRFLETASLEGVKISISTSGGAAGERTLPLMTFPEAWTILDGRCQLIAAQSPPSATVDLMEVLRTSIDACSPEHRQNLLAILRNVCRTASSEWTRRSEVLTASEIVSFNESALLLTPMPPSPDLEPSWEHGHARFTEAINQWDLDRSVDAVEEWTKLVGAMQEWEPRLLKKVRFSESADGWLTALREKIRHEINHPVRGFDLDSRRSNCAALAEHLLSLSNLDDVRDTKDFEKLADELEEEARECEEIANENSGDGQAPEGRTTTEGSFEIDDVFSDL